MLNARIKEKRKEGQYADFTFLNTNARSLCPKINSLIDTIEEMDASMAVVMETWLADGLTLEEDKQDLLLGAGLSMLCRNRQRDTRGQSYGGVTILYKDAEYKFKEVSFNNPEGFEVLAAIGNLQGHTRRIAVLACYMLPIIHHSHGRFQSMEG